jgi:hypothetical protein
MNTRIKIAAGVFAGLVAGVTLVGTAVAAPRMMTTPSFYGYEMMRAPSTSSISDRPTIAEMNAFMSSYVTADGSIDIGRMRSQVASGQGNPPTIAEMNAFMSRYVTADGSIDVNRMHADVTSDKVTPPCLDGASGANNGSNARSGSTSYRRGPAMMQGYTSSGSSNGYNMMDSVY